MPNAGYPDNDDSRTVSGDHSTAAGLRKSLFDCEEFTRPANIAEMRMVGDRLNNQTDSAGNTYAAVPRYPIDGDAGQRGTGYNPADYPSYTSSA